MYDTPVLLNTWMLREKAVLHNTQMFFCISSFALIFSFVRFFLNVNQGFFWVRDDTALLYTLNIFSGHGLMMNSVFGLHCSPKMSIALGYFKSITRIILRSLFRNLARGNLNDKDERAKNRERCRKSTT